jgi:hypothetical protein
VGEPESYPQSEDRPLACGDERTSDRPEVRLTNETAERRQRRFRSGGRLGNGVNRPANERRAEAGQ